MQDIAHGSERARSWPRTRGKPKTKKQQEAQDKFRLAQVAARYIAPTIMADIQEARKGTPLLPRDIVTAMIYNTMCYFAMNNGKVLYPMTARVDVSQALDTITQTPGQSLIRTENGWDAYTPGGGGGGGLIDDFTISSPIAEYISPNIDGTSNLLIVGMNITCSGNLQRAVQVSQDNGTTWLTTVGDYNHQADTGANTPLAALYTQFELTSAARSLVAALFALDVSEPSPFASFTQGRAAIVTGKTAPINRIRLVPMQEPVVQGTMNSGRIIILGL